MMRFINTCACTMLACCSFQQAYTQFSDSAKHHVTLNSSGTLNRANGNQTYFLNNSFLFGIKTKSVAFNSNNTWLYGKQNTTLVNNDFSSATFFNLYKTFPHFYYWGLFNYNTSYSLNVNYQLLSGLGIAYSLIDTTTAYINFSDGLLYDKSNILLDEDYNTFRNSFRLQYFFLIKDRVTIEGNNFYQKSLSRGDDYIIRSKTTVAFRLNKWLSLTTTFIYNRMNITHRDNLNFTYGLTVDKWF